MYLVWYKLLYRQKSSYVLGVIMIRVVQQDSTSCGLACIATLARTKYSDAKDVALDLLDLEPNDEFYTTAPQLKTLGQAFKLN